MKKLPNPVNYQIYQGQSLERPGLYDYVLAGNGVFKTAKGDHFHAAIPLGYVGQIAGLPDFNRPPLVLYPPKIPAKWLYAVLDHARKASGDSAHSQVLVGPIEQMYHFHWLENCWRVAVPRQQATAGRVGYRGGDEATIVLDLHSHHEMNSFFSTVDNADEQGLRFYGVIGRIYSEPEVRLRVGVYGDWLDLDPLVLFDGLGPFKEAE